MAISILGLPREVRDCIYGFFFDHGPGDDHAIRVWDLYTPREYRAPGGPAERWENPSAGLFNLLLVNHQVNDEAEQVFFQTRLFWGYHDALSTFIDAIGHRRDLLQKVDLYLEDMLWLYQEEVESIEDLFDLLSLIRDLRVFRV